MAFNTASLGPPFGPSTLPIKTFLTPGATPIRVPFTSRPKMRAGDVGPVTVHIDGRSCHPLLINREVLQVLSVERETGERLVCLVDPGIENRDCDPLAILRARPGPNGFDTPRPRSNRADISRRFL